MFQVDREENQAFPPFSIPFPLGPREENQAFPPFTLFFSLLPLPFPFLPSIFPSPSPREENQAIPPFVLVPFYFSLLPFLSFCPSLYPLFPSLARGGNSTLHTPLKAL